jgi:hypothetical protein
MPTKRNIIKMEKKSPMEKNLLKHLFFPMHGILNQHCAPWNSYEKEYSYHK